LIKRTTTEGVVVEAPRNATVDEIDTFKQLFIDLSAEDRANQIAALAAFTAAEDYIKAAKTDRLMTRQELNEANRLVQDAFAAFRVYGRTNDDLTYGFCKVLFFALDAVNLYLKNLEDGVDAAIDQGITLRADFDGHTHP
jgi:hypothetical protein